MTTSIDTKLIHDGEDRHQAGASVVMPVYHSVMFLDQDVQSHGQVRYTRYNNTPNQIALNKKLAALENAEDALVTASGMAAISTALLAVLRQGDHLLIQESIYGGTLSFLTHDFPAFGVDYDFIDPARPDTWEDAVRPNTKAIYVEVIANPTMMVGDLQAVAEFAKSHGLTSLIDNTFATPVNFRPPEWGFDLSLHSCTKYINGHSDLVAGAVIGQSELVAEVRKKLTRLGGTLGSQACAILHRGLKTLALRVRQQNDNALSMARFLEQHPAVKTVNYPGLESSPHYCRAQQFLDGYGGMLSFELAGGVQAADALLSRVTLPLITGSLGGVETLMTRPAVTSHGELPQATRLRMGVTDELIRMSVGIESCDELVDDLGQALEP